MTALPMDEIERVADSVDFGGGAKRVIVALIYYPSLVVGRLVRSLTWCWAACKVGYKDGRRPQVAPSNQPPPTAQDRTTR